MIEGLFSSNNYEATKKLLDIATVRHEALATNIANVETPGYKRVDLARDFEGRLRAQLRAGDVSSVAPRLSEDTTAPSTRADGNNVQLDRELLEMTTNSTNFEVLSQFASGSLRQLRTAITGRNP